MNHSALIRRAFDIMRRYRVLWIFGILVALTAGGSSLPSSSGTGYDFDASDLRAGNWPDWLRADEWARQWPQQWNQWFDRFDPGRYVGIFIACCCLLLLLAILAVIVQYVSRAALIRSVDRIETTGSAPRFREGWRLGWSNRAFRLWLLELLVGILVVLAALILLAFALAPLLLLLVQSDAARAIGIVVSVFLGLVVLLILFAAAIMLSVLGQFWAREIVLGDRSIGDALAGGYALVRSRLRDVGLLWLLMAGIQIGVTILLIPVVLLVLAIAAVVGGGLGYAVYALVGSVGWAVALGLPIFFLVLAVPLTFVSGLYETFKSSVWTLAYREVAPVA